MPKKIISLAPISVIRDYWGRHWDEKYDGKRFEVEDFRKEIRDHLTGGPPEFSNWQFRRMAEMKVECYADALTEADKAVSALERLAAELPPEQAEKLREAAARVESSMQHFTNAALVPGDDSKA